MTMQPKWTNILSILMNMCLWDPTTVKTSKITKQDIS